MDYTWSTSEADGRASQLQYHPSTEGIDFRPTACWPDGGCTGQLFFVSKRAKRLLTLFIDSRSPDVGVAHMSSTESGANPRNPVEKSKVESAGEHLPGTVSYLGLGISAIVCESEF